VRTSPSISTVAGESAAISSVSVRASRCVKVICNAAGRPRTERGFDALMETPRPVRIMSQPS
jgi:hypothetical protein